MDDHENEDVILEVKHLRKGYKGTEVLKDINFKMRKVSIMGLTSYSKSIQKHIAKPNKDLVESLEKITLGDYSNRLTINGEYEYKEIEEAFNFMVYELEKAKKERENLEKERQQLFSSIAHDLRTPITTIKGYTRALLDKIIETQEKQEEYLNTIFRKADKMNELIDLLMIYAKMSNEEYKLNLEKVDFKDFILEIVAEYFNEFEKNHVYFDIITDNGGSIKLIMIDDS